MKKKELEALVEEQQATIEEQGQIVAAKQARIKELDEQVMSVQGILENMFQLGITTIAISNATLEAEIKVLAGDGFEEPIGFMRAFEDEKGAKDEMD